MSHEAKQNRRQRTTSRALGLLATTGLLCCATALPAQLTLHQAMLLQRHGHQVEPPADATPAAPPLTTEQSLLGLASQAAIIFRGQVLSIQAEQDAVRIDLRVDEGICGVMTGQTFTLREWKGLWTAGSGRYQVGERALFLLHEPSAAGFTSPVSGADGVIPVSGDEVSSAVDLRWVAARVARSVVTRADNAPDGATAVASAVYLNQGIVEATVQHRADVAANGIAWPSDASNGNVLGPDLHRIDTTLVTGLLRAASSSALSADLSGAY